VELKDPITGAPLHPDFPSRRALLLKLGEESHGAGGQRRRVGRGGGGINLRRIPSRCHAPLSLSRCTGESIPGLSSRKVRLEAEAAALKAAQQKNAAAAAASATPSGAGGGEGGEGGGRGNRKKKKGKKGRK
jgi:hypothetical protein